MGLISKTVKLKMVGRQIKRYKELGYNFNYKDTIEIKVEDLPINSSARVLCQCDEKKCDNIKEISYASYNLTIKKNGFYRCFQCGQKIKKEVFFEKYGVDNPAKLPEIKEKIKQTNLERYGASSQFARKDFNEIKRKVCLERYGVEHQLQNQEVKNKVKQTNFFKYGYEYCVQVPEFKEQIKQTNLKRYGCENPLSNIIIQNKIKDTNINRYGFANPLMNFDIRKKAQETCLKKYGHKSSLGDPDVYYKSKTTRNANGNIIASKQQVYLNNLYNGILNYPINIYSADIFVDKLYDIEYDGGGHRLNVKLGEITDEEFDKLEVIRNATIEHAGYKTIRIISRKDYLPSDTILLQMLSDAKQYFSDYPNHSWITFDIDEGIVKNAECKNGRSYFYGQLHKIK